MLAEFENKWEENAATIKEWQKYGTLLEQQQHDQTTYRMELERIKREQESELQQAREERKKLECIERERELELQQAREEREELEKKYAETTQLAREWERKLVRNAFCIYFMADNVGLDQSDKDNELGAMCQKLKRNVNNQASDCTPGGEPDMGRQRNASTEGSSTTNPLTSPERNTAQPGRTILQAVSSQVGWLLQATFTFTEKILLHPRLLVHKTQLHSQ
jgi:hypothetical protein